MPYEFTFKDCYARWDEGTLVIGNSRIRREFSCKGGKLSTTALSLPGGIRFEAVDLSPESLVTYQDGTFDLGAENEFTQVQVSAEIDRNPLRHDALHIMVEFSGWSEFKAVKHFRIWPEVAAVHSQLEVEALKDASNLDYTRTDALNLAWTGSKSALRAVEFHDFSDTTCRFVTERDYNKIGTEPLRLVGNFLLLQSGSGGIFCYKESPTSCSQLYPVYYDYQVSSSSIAMIGAGFHNLPAGKPRTTYASIVGIYEGGEDDAILAWKQYQRARYRLVPERDFGIFSNSWGDFREKMNEENAMAEIEAAAELGITDVQIDAGWSDYVMGGGPSPERFAHGFEPLISRAKELGVRMGIWTIPVRLANSLDVIREHPDWIARNNNRIPCDLQTSYFNITLVGVELLNPDCFQYMKDYYKWLYNLGFRRFKSDTFQLTPFNSVMGDLYDHYEAFRRLQEELVLECPGLTFDQDITRPNRPTYDFSLDYGCIFPENRYQTWQGNGNYKPNKPLSTLWQLAPYIPPQKFMIELCNDEPGYSAGYLFAVTMFSNPLFWESLAAISPESKEELKPLIRLYKEHQAAIFAGHIFRLGEDPDGTRWTGLQSHQPEAGEGYMIIFREDNPDKTCRFFPKFLRGRTVFESLTDDTAALICDAPAGGVEITLPSSFSYRLYRYRRI